MNCPVTSEDVDNAEKIFGPNIRMRKGKTTRKKPTTVKKDMIEVPKELIEKACCAWTSYSSTVCQC